MRIAIVLICNWILFCEALHADWPQFRGPNSSGVVDAELPMEFGPGKNELWSVPLGSGHSSPCIAGDSIFVTTYDKPQKLLEVVCIDRGDGSIRWRRPVPAEKIERGHPSFNPASSSPATDGERVVAYFGSCGLICFDIDGNKLWVIPMPLTRSYAGNATSPAIIGDRVILYRSNHVDHYLLAVDKHTGNELWKVPQAEPFADELACTACPIAVGDKLIMHSARSLQAFDIATGERLWVTKCATTATSTPVIAGDEVIVAAWNKMGEPALRPEFPSFTELVSANDKDGDTTISRDEFPRMMIFHRPEGAEAPQNGAAMGFRHCDKNNDGKIAQHEWQLQLQQLAHFRAGYHQHGIIAVPLDSEGVIPPDQVRTLVQQGIPEVPSPLFHDGIVYFVKNGGLLSCVDVTTGKRLSRMRTRGKGTHYGSPIIAGDKLYCTAGDGRITVLSLGGTPKILAVNDMGENVYATPAVADDTLFVRTHSRLYAFALSK